MPTYHVPKGCEDRVLSILTRATANGQTDKLREVLGDKPGSEDWVAIEDDRQLVNEPGAYGGVCYPLLLHATLWGHPECAKCLLDNGADVNIVHRCMGASMTAVDIAMIHNNADMAALLQEHGGKTAAEVEEIREAEDYLYVIANRPSNILTYSAVRMRLNSGANINTIRDGEGTPLDVAMKKGHPAMINLLRGFGAKTSDELNAEVEAKKAAEVATP